MALQLQTVWRNYIEKDVHNIFVILNQELYLDKLHELQSELQRDLGHYEWTNIHRSGFLGVRRVRYGNRRFAIDDDKVIDIIRGVCDSVLKSNARKPPRPLIITGAAKIVQA